MKVPSNVKKIQKSSLNKKINSQDINFRKVFQTEQEKLLEMAQQIITHHLLEGHVSTAKWYIQRYDNVKDKNYKDKNSQLIPKQMLLSLFPKEFLLNDDNAAASPNKHPIHKSATMKHTTKTLSSHKP